MLCLLMRIETVLGRLVIRVQTMLHMGGLSPAVNIVAAEIMLSAATNAALPAVTKTRAPCAIGGSASSQMRRSSAPSSSGVRRFTATSSSGVRRFTATSGFLFIRRRDLW